MNEHWRKKINEFSEKFDAHDQKWIPLMNACPEFGRALNQEFHREQARTIEQNSPYVAESFTKNDAKDIIEEYLGKAKELTFWELLILGK